MGKLRLGFDAVPSSGKQHTSGHAQAAFARLLDELGDKAPALVRGDSGYGNEDVIDVCEQRGICSRLYHGGRRAPLPPSHRRIQAAMNAVAAAMSRIAAAARAGGTTAKTHGRREWLHLLFCWAAQKE